MRHALGLDGQTPAPSSPEHRPAENRPAEHAVAPTLSSDRLSLHRPPRRFVKDGEVQVTMVRRTHPSEAAAGLGPAAHSQLESARQTIRSQAVATERAERALADAQNAIRDVRTKLAHERLAKDEALQALRRVEAERDAAQVTIQAMRIEVATERVGREKLEQELRRVLEARDAKKAQVDGQPKRRGRPPKIRPLQVPVPQTDIPQVAGDSIMADGAEPIVVPRKRGRPRKVVVESAEPLAPPRKRGRPRKVPLATTEPSAPPRPRGRPRKVPVVEQAELSLSPEQQPRRRGRPPKVREPKPVKWWAKGWKASGD